MITKRFLLLATFLSAVAAAPASAGSTESSSAAGVSAESVTGISARAFVGAAVHNTEGERIGEVDDLIVGNDQRVTHAVIDVGGFLGMGEKSVVIPFTELRISEADGIVVLANREQLEALPAFSYSTTEDYRIDTEQRSETMTPEQR